MRKKLAIVISAVLTLHCSAANAMLLAGLTDVEQDYHHIIFDYVMNNINPGIVYDWSSYNGKGKLIAGEPFVSKSRSTCREFGESFIVQGKQGTYNGVGCRRSNGDGWCQLKTTDAQTCSMEHPDYMISGLMPDISMPNIPDVNINVPDVSISGNVNITGPTLNMPTIRNPIGNIGSLVKPAGNNNNTANNGKGPEHNPNSGQASNVSYGVTDTLGNGAAKGTGLALSWFNTMFR